MIKNFGYNNRCNLILVFNCVLFLRSAIKNKKPPKISEVNFATCN